MITKRTLATAALTGVLITLAPATRSSEPRVVKVAHWVFPGLHRMDGNWAALLAASDGKVYAGLAYHGGGHVVYFDSKTGVMDDLGDLNELTGEQDLRPEKF